MKTILLLLLAFSPARASQTILGSDIANGTVGAANLAPGAVAADATVGGVSSSTSPWTSGAAKTSLAAIPCPIPVGLVGDGSTDNSAALQKALNTYGCISIGTGQYNFSNSINVPGGTAIKGNGTGNTTFNYTGSTVAFANPTPGTRIYAWLMKDFVLQRGSLLSGTTGFLMDSVSISEFDNVVVQNFGTAWDIYSPVDGESVYNRFYNTTASSIHRGYVLRGNSSNANTFSACRSTGFDLAGFDIYNGNENHIKACQIESNLGTGIVINGAAFSASNNFIESNRFEGSMSTAIYVGANVDNTVVMPQYFEQSNADILDLGTNTKELGGGNSRLWLTMGSGSGGDLSGVGFKFQRGTNGGTLAAGLNDPLFYMNDPISSFGNPTTLRIQNARYTGLYLEGRPTDASADAFAIDGLGSFYMGENAVVGASTATVDSQHFHGQLEIVSNNSNSNSGADVDVVVAVSSQDRVDAHNLLTLRQSGTLAVSSGVSASFFSGNGAALTGILPQSLSAVSTPTFAAETLTNGLTSSSATISKTFTLLSGTSFYSNGDILFSTPGALSPSVQINYSAIGVPTIAIAGSITANKATFGANGNFFVDSDSQLYETAVINLGNTLYFSNNGAARIQSQSGNSTIYVNNGATIVNGSSMTVNGPGAAFTVGTSSMSVFISTQGAFDVSGGTNPTLSGCGASPTIAAGSNVERGHLTMGSGAASGGCTLGFPGIGFGKTPNCVMSCGGEGSLLACGQTANSTVTCDTVTTGVNTACGTGTFVSWICLGN